MATSKTTLDGRVQAKNISYSITTVCMLITGVFTSIVLALLLHQVIAGYGNHWFLFGTWVDRTLSEHRFLVAGLMSFPMLIPLMIRRSRKASCIAVVGIVIFGFLSFAFGVMVD